MSPVFLAGFWLVVAALALRAAIELSRALVALGQLSTLALRPRPAVPPVILLDEEESLPIKARTEPAPRISPPPAEAASTIGETNYLDTMSDEELDGLLKFS